MCSGYLWNDQYIHAIYYSVLVFTSFLIIILQSFYWNMKYSILISKLSMKIFTIPVWMQYLPNNSHLTCIIHSIYIIHVFEYTCFLLFFGLIQGSDLFK